KIYKKDEMIFLHRQNNINKKIENYGVEIDLRYNGDIVLNHDLLESDQKYPLLNNKIDFFVKNIPIICNIKESGIEEKIAKILRDYDYYFLDSQIPDILRLSKNGYEGRFIIRVSDVETLNKELIKISKPKYAWIDYSKFSEFDLKLYKEFIINIKLNLKNITPILVSPELYDLSYLKLINEIQNILPKGFFICTKEPTIWMDYVQS
ncbi:hypothetical protein, partial [Campylobacter molothri]